MSDTEGPLARALREGQEEQEKSEAANADYTGEPCAVCGRIRVYLRKDGQHQCEKCETIFPVRSTKETREGCP